jgi:N-methylhydantoinase B
VDTQPAPATQPIDPAELAIAHALFASVAGEMGVTLGRTAHSPNIKERRDYSCALFDPEGRLVAQAAHIPVHLGAMPAAVQAALSLAPFAPGDIVILNDPYLGGTHLPDITMVSPVFAQAPPADAGAESADAGGKLLQPPASNIQPPNPSNLQPPASNLQPPTLIGFLASRAHHADVGGISPGSMPIAQELIQEGIVIPPIKLFEAGRLNRAVLDLLLRNMRAPDERRGDLDAQIAAHRTGERRLQEIAARLDSGTSGPVHSGGSGFQPPDPRGSDLQPRFPRGSGFQPRFPRGSGFQPDREAEWEQHPATRTSALMSAIMDYAERMTRHAISRIPDGEYEFEDALDDDGATDDPLPIRVRITVTGDVLHADFTGSAPERPTSINAVAAVTRSALYYVVRCLLDESVPSNDGCFRPVTLTLPERSVVNASPPRAVAAGNVETSQRIVDALLGALAPALPDLIPAASQGTMNNVTIGGWDPERGRPFAYYETIGGGTGGAPAGDGLDAVHSHMTNTLNTPVEALEMTYPFRIAQYAVRPGAGGRGAHRGGNGIVRTWHFLASATLTLLTERRRLAPWGLAGGGPGQTGRNLLQRGGGPPELLPSKTTIPVLPGDRLTVETPGGGAWGPPPRG